MQAMAWLQTLGASGYAPWSTPIDKLRKPSWQISARLYALERATEQFARRQTETLDKFLLDYFDPEQGLIAERFYKPARR